MSKYTGYKYSEAQEAWKRDNTRHYGMRMNKNTDADVIEQLDKQPSIQGYIKRLVREDIERERSK